MVPYQVLGTWCTEKAVLKKPYNLGRKEIKTYNYSNYKINRSKTASSS